MTRRVNAVRCLTSGAILCAMHAVTAQASAAEVRVTEDYAAVIFEGEDTVERDERWVLTEPGTPAQENDPDGNHSDGASGSAYLELLPDVRVTHTDPWGPPAAYWGEPGAGPMLSYEAQFPEPGRYHVHIRAYTTGTEDNGIHVGLDGEWPESGARIQVCAAGEEDWRWSSRQRYAGGSPCGVDKSVWLTVEKAGAGTVMFSAREDGFEIDRVMLIKDRSGGTRVCSPLFDQPDEIGCSDGNIPVSDERVDLAVALTVSEARIEPGETVEVAATLRNEDVLDEASDVRLRFDLDPDQWRVRSIDWRCSSEAEDIVCALENLGPRASGDETILELALQALAEGVHRIEVVANASEQDDDTRNDRVRADIEVGSAALDPTTLNAALATASKSVPLGTAVAFELSVENAGQSPALGTTLSLTVPRGLVVPSPPNGCGVFDRDIVCSLGTLGEDRTETFAVSITPEVGGTYTLAVAADAANADSTETPFVLEVTAAAGDPSEKGGKPAGGGESDPAEVEAPDDTGSETGDGTANATSGAGESGSGGTAGGGGENTSGAENPEDSREADGEGASPDDAAPGGGSVSDSLPRVTGGGAGGIPLLVMLASVLSYRGFGRATRVRADRAGRSPFSLASAARS